MTTESNSSPAQPSAEIIQFRPRQASLSLSKAVALLRQSGAVGDPQPLSAVYTPSGRLTPLDPRGAKHCRRLHRGGRPKAWKSLDDTMAGAEQDMEAALIADDGAAADEALERWQEAAEAAIYCPTTQKNDLRDRLRLLAHVCGVADPIGGYFSTAWESRSTLGRLFTVLDWHMWRALDRMDEGKDQRRLHSRLESLRANDDGELEGVMH